MITPKGGINLRLAPWDPEMEERNQCVSLRNFRFSDEYFEMIPGTKKYHGTSLSSRISAIMPYYNDQNDNYVLLIAAGGGIYRRDPQANEFTLLKSGLTSDSIFSSVIRHGVQYIPSIKDGLKKYLGGSQIETVGGGSTAPGNFKYIIYAREVDRLFGISEDAIYGQISWCDLSDPETWDGASVERFKLKDGEKVEGADLLYGKLIVFCTYTVWIYYISGNEENWRLEEAPTAVGCVAGNTIKKVGNEIWYLADPLNYVRGVYGFNGTVSRRLSDDVNPLLKRINKNKIQNACAVVYEDIYTISFALDASETNDTAIDLDAANNKEDGTPAIYGPHDLGFFSSCVLNTRQNNKELLLGDESDGFVYQMGGTTAKSVNGSDGSLIQQQFISMVHNEKSWDTLKRYEKVQVFFHPRGYFQARLKFYMSYGGYGQTSNFHTQVERSGFAGDFDVYDKRIYGTPGLSEHQEHLPLHGGRGTSIQIELINDVLARRLSFQGYGYSINKEKTQMTKKAPIYAA